MSIGSSVPTFLVQFGSGNPAQFTGFTPTFLVFNALGVGATTPPSISEATGAGLYYFTYNPIGPVAFTMYANANSATLAPSLQYVSGMIDPISTQNLSNAYVTLSAIGLSLAALGQTVASNSSFVSQIGSLTDSFGSTAADPTSVFGYLKRMQEFNEGNNVFTKQSGSFQIWSRGITYTIGATTSQGSSTMLINKTVVDSGSIITKS